MEFLILRSSIKGPSSVLPNTECVVHKLQINFFLTSNCRGFPRETEVIDWFASNNCRAICVQTALMLESNHCVFFVFSPYNLVFGTKVLYYLQKEMCRAHFELYSDNGSQFRSLLLQPLLGWCIDTANHFIIAFQMAAGILTHSLRKARLLSSIFNLVASSVASFIWVPESDNHHLLHIIMFFFCIGLNRPHCTHCILPFCLRPLILRPCLFRCQLRTQPLPTWVWGSDRVNRLSLGCVPHCKKESS